MSTVALALGKNPIAEVFLGNYCSHVNATDSMLAMNPNEDSQHKNHFEAAPEAK
jgi:hypothetical protein